MASASERAVPQAEFVAKDQGQAAEQQSPLGEALPRNDLAPSRGRVPADFTPDGLQVSDLPLSQRSPVSAQRLVESPTRTGQSDLLVAPSSDAQQAPAEAVSHTARRGRHASQETVFAGGKLTSTGRERRHSQRDLTDKERAAQQEESATYRENVRRNVHKDLYGCAIRAAESAFGVAATNEETDLRLDQYHQIMDYFDKVTGSNQDREFLTLTAREVEALDRANVSMFYHIMSGNDTPLGKEMSRYTMTTQQLQASELEETIQSGKKVIIAGIRPETENSQRSGHAVHVGMDEHGFVDMVENSRLVLVPDSPYFSFVFEERAQANGSADSASGDGASAGEKKTGIDEAPSTLKPGDQGAKGPPVDPPGLGHEGEEDPERKRRLGPEHQVEFTTAIKDLMGSPKPQHPLSPDVWHREIRVDENTIVAVNMQLSETALEDYPTSVSDAQVEKYSITVETFERVDEDNNNVFKERTISLTPDVQDTDPFSYLEKERKYDAQGQVVMDPSDMLLTLSATGEAFLEHFQDQRASGAFFASLARYKELMPIVQQAFQGQEIPPEPVVMRDVINTMRRPFENDAEETMEAGVRVSNTVGRVLQRAINERDADPETELPSFEQITGIGFAQAVMFELEGGIHVMIHRQGSLIDTEPSFDRIQFFEPIAEKPYLKQVCEYITYANGPLLRFDGDQLYERQEIEVPEEVPGASVLQIIFKNSEPNAGLAGINDADNFARLMVGARVINFPLLEE